MVFSPNLDRLLKRPAIKKPHEEFELPPPQSEEFEPELTVKRPEDLPREPDLLESLYNEASELQDLIDLLTDTAVPLEVAVPLEDRELLGERITTQDYLESVGKDDFRSRRIRDHYEFSLLSGCGENYGWPILALPDLFDIQSGLLQAASVVEGALLEAAQIPSTTDSWKRLSTDSHLSVVHESLIENSQAYRLQLGRAVLSMRQDAKSELLTALLDPVLSAEDKEIKAQLERVIQVLRRLRYILCKSQLLMAFEFRQVREALQSLVQEKLLESLLQMLSVILHQVHGTIVHPILDLFERGIGGRPLLERLGDRVSHEIATVVGATLQSLTSQYTEMLADLLRAKQKESKVRLTKLQVLGQRNIVGRWVGHLDRVISTLERLKNETSLSDAIRRQMTQSLLERHARPQAAVLDRFEQHPAFQQIRDQEFPIVLSLDGGDGFIFDEKSQMETLARVSETRAPIYRSERSTIEERS